MTCTANPYVVTAADVTNGKITNTALAAGTSPTGVRVTSAFAAAQVTVPAAGLGLPVTGLRILEAARIGLLLMLLGAGILLVTNRRRWNRA
jgi:hypothetical protein